MKIKVGLGSCGIAAGGRKVLKALQDGAKEFNLNVEIEETGCIGMCFYEPIVDIVTDDGTYSYGFVDEKIAKEIIEKHVKEGNILENNIIYTSKKPAKYTAKQHKIALENCGVINPEK